MKNANWVFQEFPNIYKDIYWHTSAASKALGAILPPLMASINARTVIEIGVASGFTSQIMGKALSVTAEDDGLMISCDICPGSCDHGRAFTKDLPIRHVCLVCDSRDIHWPEHLGDRQIDLAMIDGDHTFEFVYYDLKNCIPYLNPNGFVVMHDYSYGQPGVVEAVRKLFEDEPNGWSSIVLADNNRTVDYQTVILQRKIFL